MRDKCFECSILTLPRIGTGKPLRLHRTENRERGQACDFAILVDRHHRREITSGAMARQSRVEVEGGLYHLITRGNNRQAIFHDSDDYLKFLTLLQVPKGRLPLFLFAKT